MVARKRARPFTKLERRLIPILRRTAYQVYASVIVPRTPRQQEIHAAITDVRVGKWVAEISTVGRQPNRTDVVGRLLAIEHRERLGPTYLIELFNGRQVRWSNCSLIVILEKFI